MAHGVGVWRRWAKRAKAWSSLRSSWLMVEAEKLTPQRCSVMALTLRVETPWTYISASASTRAFSFRWDRSNSAVENSPLRSRGTRSFRLPMRVTKPRLESLAR